MESPEGFGRLFRDWMEPRLKAHSADRELRLAIDLLVHGVPDAQYVVDGEESHPCYSCETDASKVAEAINTLRALL